MTYDVAYRHQQALDPSSLDTIATCLHAIQASAKDCRAAGVAFESDPAVVLLAQHLGTIAQQAYPDSADLRRLCSQAIADIRARPALAILARQGVAHDAGAKRLFHAEAKRALARLAERLGLVPADYELRVAAGGPAVSGEVVLHADRVYVQVSLGGFGPGEVLFRSVRGRRDFTGGRNYWAGIDALLSPDRLAERIAHAVGLDRPDRATLPLVA